MRFQAIRQSGLYLTGYPSLLAARTVTCDVYILVELNRWRGDGHPTRRPCFSWPGCWRSTLKLGMSPYSRRSVMTRSGSGVPARHNDLMQCAHLHQRQRVLEPLWQHLAACDGSGLPLGLLRTKKRPPSSSTVGCKLAGRRERGDWPARGRRL